ncbi:MAG: carboxymuconolactone decarboxylase family protein [Acidimicrobiales bacterium]|nr:carboxymuconolactone decarboxylase family protein [Acidimicrobiales bacterium]
MAEGRVPRLTPGEARAAAAGVDIPEFMADLSVFQVLLHSPKAAAGLYGMLQRLLWEGTLDARLRELIIMRLGWSTASEYEWTQHWRVARQLDVAEEDLLAVRDWRASERFGPVEQAVLAATDDVVATGVISEESWTRCAQELQDPALLVELVVAIGNWHLFSSLLRSLQIPLEDGVTPWPPDGRSPA